MNCLKPRLILIVDDDESVRRLMLRALRHEALRPVAVASVKEALEFMEEEWPAALVVDYMLPDGTGADLLRRLREDMLEMTPPAILVTGSLEAVGSEERQLFVSTHAKPAAVAELRAAVLELAQTRTRHRSGVMIRGSMRAVKTGTDEG